MQQRFSLAAALLGIALAAAVLLAHGYFLSLPDREELGPRAAELRFEPVALDAAKFAPLRLDGAWTVTSEDPRIGGVSALAIDGGDLIALTDSGATIRFPKAIAGKLRATVRELPVGPGDSGFKLNRDSEALVRDPAGRGWWVAFENRDQLWLYDPRLIRSLQRGSIPKPRLTYNTGIEGMAVIASQLLLFPETGGFALQLGRSGWGELVMPVGRLSDATALPDGSLLVVERSLSLAGFANGLVRLKRCGAGYCVSWRKPLAVAALDNVEAIAAEPLESGGAHLWLATDDNMHRRLRTLLISADLPPKL